VERGFHQPYLLPATQPSVWKQRTEHKALTLTNPPFFIHNRIPDGSVVAPFMVALWRQCQTVSLKQTTSDFSCHLMGILLQSSADQPRSQNVSQCRVTEYESIQVRCRCRLPTNLVFIRTAITQSDLDSVISATLFLFAVLSLLIFCTYLCVQTKLATHKIFNYYIMHFRIVYLIPYHNRQHQSTTKILSDTETTAAEQKPAAYIA